MRKYKNLDLLVKQHKDVLNKQIFIDLLIADLKQSVCSIFGETIDDEPVLLAKLTAQANSLTHNNGLFQQQIEFVVEGKIINDQYPPINYSVNGSIIEFFGRCSSIPQICGVDLYLDKSYTKIIGDPVKQKFTIPINPLFRSIKKT